MVQFIELIALVFSNGLKCRNKYEIASMPYFCFPTGLLDLTGNSFTEVPLVITKLTNLKELYFNDNILTNFPDVSQELINLKLLSLSSNPLAKIDDSISKMKDLEEVFMSFTYLKNIPESIVNLKNLKNLVMRGSYLNDLPQEILNLTQLEKLNLSRNSFNKIPRTITLITSLQRLYLNKNQITEITEEISNLYNLQKLDLRGNQIKEIPKAITRLTNLETLDLSFNSLSEIPDSITRLTNLETLDLRNNSLSMVPDSITRLTNLSYLGLYQNPITEPPLEVVKEGIEAIRQYFKQIETEGVDYLYEAKLLIVGEGGAGKTSLANKIINPDYQLCEEDSTKGIEVSHWAFPRTDGKQFNVNIWDFGGQEIYHSTHQYFLTKRSLYLLVADTRKEDTDFYYWLNVIELLSDNSPILIIKNEKQDRQREINVNQLRGEFGSFKDVFATNLATNRDLDKILTEAQHQLSQLPHIGQTLPKTWVKVRRDLENEPRNYISLNEYLQICKDNGFKERKDALQLSDYLHDLGICLHFQDDEMSPLYQIVILKPKWGTDAAYAVLDNPEVIRNFGRFSNKELAQIWSADEYSGMHSGLLELMKKFQLCYEIPQEKGSYIAPQLLTENQPKYAWDESENLILRYTYDFMPKGIVCQFIVTMHESIEAQNVWRSGVIIHKREYANTRAEVIENYGKREIKIRVTGKNKRDLLTIVTHELDKIHNSYKRLADKYQKLIPCNCNTCKGSQSPHFYPFATLQEFLSDRQLEIQCQKRPYNMVNVRNLLDDIGETREDDRQILREKEWQNANNGKNVIEFKPQITVQPQFTIQQQQQQQGGTMDNQQQQSNSDNSQQQQQSSRPLRPKSSWANGSFYLFLFVVVIGGIGYLAGTLKLLNLIAVIVAGIVFIPLVGALQLRQDDRLSEQNFMELLKLVVAQLPIISKISQKGLNNKERD
jgi:small GTP-binding protein